MLKNCRGKSAAAAQGAVEQRQRRESDRELEESLLRFDPNDHLYKIGCCNILNAFVTLATLQYIFSLLFFLFTCLQLIVMEIVSARRRNDQSQYDHLNREHLSFFQPMVLFGASGNISTDIYFKFDFMSWTRLLYPLIYFRLFLLIAILASIKCALFGLYKNKLPYVRFYVVCTLLYILLLVLYVILLTWHTIKMSDYFTFSLLGISLLTVLLLNVTCLNTANSCVKFLRTRRKFLAYAYGKHWITEDEFLNRNPPLALANRRTNCNACRSLWSCFYEIFTCKLYNKYALPTELRHKARRLLEKRSFDRQEPMTSRNLMTLAEINEEENEEDEQEQLQQSGV